MRLKEYIFVSGGPFLNLNLKKFKDIKPKDALNHPNGKWVKKFQ